MLSAIPPVEAFVCADDRNSSRRTGNSLCTPRPAAGRRQVRRFDALGPAHLLVSLDHYSLDAIADNCRVDLDAHGSHRVVQAVPLARIGRLSPDAPRDSSLGSALFRPEHPRLLARHRPWNSDRQRNSINYKRINHMYLTYYIL